MKKTLTLFAVLVLHSLFAQKGNTFSSYETLENVEIIQIQDNLCIVLYPADFYGVQIKGDKSLKDIIKWDFKNSVLELYTTEENTMASNAEITLYVKGVKELRLAGNASVHSDKKMVAETFALYSGENSTYGFPLECKDFSLISSGESSGYIDLTAENVRLNTKDAASISLKVQASQVNVEQTDNSIVSLRGNTQALGVIIDKKARLTAWALKAKDVYLMSSNTEDINIHAEKRLKINGLGNGKIYVTGNPTQIDTIAINKKTKIIYHAQ